MRLKKPLFTDSFPFVRTDAELEDLIQSNPILDSYYVTSASEQNRKEWFEKLWEDHWDLADDHFLSEIRQNFHARSWEMYLSYILRKRGYRLDSKTYGPDLVVAHEIPIYIEAIAPGHGVGEHAVPPIAPRIVRSFPEREIMLRITSAFGEKTKKFKNDVSNNYIEDDSVKVIALNAGIFQYPTPFVNRMMKVCFGIGDPVLRIGIGGEEVENDFQDLPNITKGDSTVPTILFTDPANSHISAVILF